MTSFVWRDERRSRISATMPAIARPDRDADEQQEAEHLALRIDEARVRADLVGAVEREGQDHRDDHAESRAEEQEDRELRGAAQPHPLDVVLDVLGHASIVPPPAAAGTRATVAVGVRGAAAAGPTRRRGCRTPGCGRRMRHPPTASSPSARAIQVAGVGLDDVRRRAARVPRPLDDLHGAERRHPHLDAVPGRLLGQQLQQVPHGRREIGARGAADAAPPLARPRAPRGPRRS